MKRARRNGSTTTSTTLDPVLVFGAPLGLSQQLGALERDLRHAWASLLDVNTEAAGRIGDAGRLIHRARALLDDTTLIR